MNLIIAVLHRCFFKAFLLLLKHAALQIQLLVFIITYPDIHGLVIDLLLVGLIAQLVEHCIGIAERSVKLIIRLQSGLLEAQFFL